MYSNAFYALDGISKSSRERKRLDFHAESGNKRAFLSGKHEIFIIDTITLSFVVFSQLGEIILTPFYLSHSRKHSWNSVT